MQRFSFLLRACMLILLAAGCGRWSFASTSAQVLEIPVDARTTSMGEAFSAVAGDAAMLWTNPAGLIGLKVPEIRASFRRDIEDVNFGSLTGVYPLADAGVIGLGLLTLYGGILDEADLNTSTVAEQDIVIDLAYAYDLTRVLSWPYALAAGLNAKFLHSTLANEFTGQAFAGDVGLLSGLPVPGLTLGVFVRNFGTPIKYDVSADQLPMTFGGGLSWINTLTPVFTIMVNADASQTIERNLTAVVGAELSIIKTLQLRGGYRFFNDTDSVTLGIGLTAYQFQLDYSFLENSLADKHLVTLGYKFGGGPAATVQAQIKNDSLALAAKGIALYKQGRLQESKKAWADILTQNPDNPAAKEYLGNFNSIQKHWLEERNDLADERLKQEDYVGAATIWRDNLIHVPRDARSLAGLARLESIADGHVQRADSLAAQKSWMNAVGELDVALDIIPDYPPARKKREIIYASLQQQAEQKERLAKAAIAQARQLAASGQPADAMALVRNALAANPNHAQLIKAQEDIPALAHQAAMTLKNDHKYRQAMDLLTQITRIAPEYKQAKTSYQAINVYYRDTVATLDTQALAAYQRTNYLEAIAVWEQRFKLAPETETTQQMARAYLAQGILDYRQNKIESAIRSWERVLVLDPKQPNIDVYLKRARNKINYLKKLGLEVSQ